jgi:diketogulonate reductase-like aldo/keto reductase
MAFTAIASKELAKTGVQIPEIGLGTWQYKGGVEPLRTGIALGATFIDTAESYGTEEVVGEAIQGIRQQIFLATKVSPRHFRRSDVIAAAENSLTRLRTDYIDLYQLHWPNYTIPIAETMSAMEELVQMGKVRYIGVSNFSVRELIQAQTALSKNRIVSNQVRYSLVDRTIEHRLLPYCEMNQITVIAYSPLALGLPNIQQYDTNDVLQQVAQAAGKSPAQVALNWCISHMPVIAIPKADRMEHVRDNCGASGWQLDPAQMQELNAGMRFRRRTPPEAFARRTARRVLQHFGECV